MTQSPTMKVGVVVPVYRRPTVVLDALASVMAQTRPAHRLVIVDDGSDDPTVPSVRDWLAGRRPPMDCQLIEQPHRGAGAARNRGAQCLRDCDLLAFLDSDDLWSEDFLARAIDAMMHEADAVACSSDRRNIEGASHRSHLADMRWIAGASATDFIIRGAPGLSHSVIRARPFFDLGGFAEDIPTGQDLHLMLRLGLMGRWGYASGPVVSYRHNFAAQRGEAPPLSHAFPDRRLQRARNLERFLFQDGGSEAIAASVWKPRLAALWFRAGGQLFSLGRFDEAFDAFDKAVALDPWHLPRRWTIMWKRFGHRLKRVR